MVVSQSAEYALRAAVYLAAERVPRTTREIGDATQVPVGYLAKIMQSLVRASVVESRRGLGGGFRLARPAAQISALEVVRAIAPIERIERCPLSLTRHRGGLCALHRAIDASLADAEAHFASLSLRALGDAGPGVEPLCDAKSRARKMVE